MIDPEATEYIILNPPVYVGYYNVNRNLCFSFEHKPNIVHRFFTKLLLGWEWVDGK